MNNENSYWFKLISFWFNVRRSTGLTIPFIIGAKKYFEPNSELDTVSELLIKIKDSEIGTQIILRNCSDIGEYILGLQNIFPLFKGNEFKNSLTGKVNLIVSMDSNVLGQDLSKILTRVCLKNRNSRNEFVFFGYEKIRTT